MSDTKSRAPARKMTASLVVQESSRNAPGAGNNYAEKKEEKEEKLMARSKSRRVTRARVFRWCVTAAEMVDPAAPRLTPEAASTGDAWCWVLDRCSSRARGRRCTRRRSTATAARVAIDACC